MASRWGTLFRSTWSAGAAALLLGAPAALAQAQTGPTPAKPADAPTQAAPAAGPLTVPALAGPIGFNANPVFVEAGPFGKIYVSGALTGLALVQDNPFAGDPRNRLDLTNGQAIIQKADGPVQFYIQAGVYSFPSLGVPYLSAGRTTDEFFGPVPQAFLKIAPTDEFSVLAGKLPTLIGAEYAFTFQNMNILRGLLWNQENIINRGVQANYTSGPLAFSLSLNDGFYSGRLNWLTGSVTYTINSENTLAFVGGGAFERTTYSTLATPLAQQNSSIYNLIYTYKSGPWTVTPYLQYTHVDQDAVLGFDSSASTFGAALLATYAFNSNFALSGRAEYIDSNGSAARGAPNLLYGQGSKAFSLTITPTFQYGVFFARADAAYVKAYDTTPGLAFGRNGTKTSQARFVVETGVFF